MGSRCWTEPQRRRGVVLVGVLWVLALLSLIALNLSATSRIELKLAHNLVEAEQRRQVADAGINWALWSLLQSGTAGWLADGSRRALEFEGFQIEAAIQDEFGKLDLNRANPILLQGLFLAVGLEQQEAVALVDAIRDWSDPDELRRPNGAERDEYLAVGLAEPANRPFGRLDELLLVLGMNRELYDKVYPALTLYSGQSQVNPVVAPRLVLLAVPGTSEAIVDQYIEERRRTYERGLPPPPFNSVTPRLLAGNRSGISYAIETTVAKAGSVVSRQQVVIRRRGGQGALFEIQSISSPQQVASEADTESAGAGDPL